jgi:GTPase SAR1 family protein
MNAVKYQIAVLGFQGVGKSSLAVQFAASRFPDPPIEEVDSYMKQVELDGESTVLEILDTMGDRDPEVVHLHTYMRSCEGFILLFSICQLLRRVI